MQPSCGLRKVSTSLYGWFSPSAFTSYDALLNVKPAVALGALAPFPQQAPMAPFDDDNVIHRFLGLFPYGTALFHLRFSSLIWDLLLRG